VGSRHIEIPSDGVLIRGDLNPVPNACGVVLFAHGSGSGRLSARNRYVAESLNKRRLATLLIDLLTEEEELAERSTGHLRFDIGLLTDRLRSATRFLGQDSDTRALPVGYFGASTGAAAALAASIAFPNTVKAIVSRGGRPDLAGECLDKVNAPALLLIGSLDLLVIELNEQAFTQLSCEKELVLVSGASHLFEEEGTLDEVARLAGDWFARHLCP
jgi:putative phosphoribosyl transferase